MKISDVKKATGLSEKAIRLYEEKGLISVLRSENSYRNYDDNTIERLNTIKLFRDIGISISDIKLYFNNILSLDELLSKRKNDLETEHLINNEKYRTCLNLLNKNKNSSLKQKIIPNHSDVIIGIDIGTTSLSFIAAEIKTKNVLEAYTLPNDSNLCTNDSDLREQDPECIINKVISMAEFLCECFPNILSIGITGQMHGIVCIDENANAVSPLYTWQDGRANKQIQDGVTYCNRIHELTGNKIYTGYGFATLYYNKENNLIPKSAKTYCTIMDYVAMRLTSVKKPIMHSSNAASFGLYDAEKQCFDKKSIENLCLTSLDIPKVTADNMIIGFYHQIPVSIAIGDSQAAFYGSVKCEDTSVLVNFGTGSQIYMVSDTFKNINGLECRPYIGGKFLMCYSALCGGRAYAILENFFAAYASYITDSADSQYDIMNALAQKAYEQGTSLKVSTLFCGTRENPEHRGSISLINDKNFTPENLILGVLEGMVSELSDNFKSLMNNKLSSLVASGNAVQKNTILKKLLCDTFGMKVQTTAQKEEAALGAALFGAMCSGKISQAETKTFINYSKRE